MKNYEKYENEIKEYEGGDFCRHFTKPYVLKSDNCNGLPCDVCHVLQTIWLMKEYEEPETDWSKVKVDTPILVRDFAYEEWRKRYFVKYENGKVYAWDCGRTSWTENCMTAWEHAKIAEGEEDKI